ncbi:MAG: class I SAM-dependent RNA methyltransferase [Hyphomicrobiaceae bacterium]|nr:class I SAM-dependent RNA methyltransferase [Hyphomicrobiaceae bacterium]
MTKQKIKITALSKNGRGIGYFSGRPVFIPHALIGETWLCDTKNDEFKCIVELPDRLIPPCNHFPACGGCTTQHIPKLLYQTWKMGLLREHLTQKGINFDPKNMITFGDHKRRRCALSAMKNVSGRVLLGYHRIHSHELISLEDCLVLTPTIVKSLPGLRTLLDIILKPNITARITILQCEQGLDVDLSSIHMDKSPFHSLEITTLAHQLGLIRLTHGGDTFIMQTQPTVRLNQTCIPIPNATIFLQPIYEAERKICRYISSAVGNSKYVADLFCGIGSFTFDIAQNSKVLAIDYNKFAIASLKKGYNNSKGLKPIRTLVRDLFREPLSRRELEAFDAVIFDPPRSGAEQQAKAIASSKVKTIVAVSCNPQTLARDLKILIDGNYKLVELYPIDQFSYSAHLECVAVLKKV